MATKINKPEIIIKVFSVESLDKKNPLQKAIEAVKKTKLGLRNRELTPQSIVRVEHIKEPDENNPFWLFDFVRLRYNHGPGRASELRAVEGFDMDNGDGFAEETAMLYCPRTNILLSQYNHFGIKDGGAAKYFGTFSSGNEAIGYEFTPVFDRKMAAKLAKADMFKSVRLKIAVDKIGPDYRDEEVALGHALDIGEGLKAPFVELTIGVGHTGQTLAKKSVRKLIQSVQKLIGEDQGAVTKAQVTASSSEDDEFSASKVLDLIAPSVRYSCDVEQNPSDLRYTRESRFNALIRSRNAWIRDSK